MANSVSGIRESLAKRLGISEGVALGGATIAGYAYAFSYENGYLSHYGLPFWLIELSVVNVLITVSALILLLVLAAYGLALFPAGPWSALLFQLGNLVLPVGLTIVVVTTTNWNEWPGAAVGAVLGGLLALISLGSIHRRLILPLLLYRERGSWPERWAYAMKLEREAHTRDPDLLTHSIQSIQEAGFRRAWLFGFFLLFVFGPTVTHYLGRAAASFNTKHAIVMASPECVAVRRYRDYIVCSDFERTTRRILPSFRLIQVGATPSAFRIERLGRLFAPVVAATPSTIGKE